MERINATTGSYNFIDLFAGAGGLSEGFIQAGFSPVAHVEMNPYAAQTLETRTGYYYLKAQGKLDIYKDYISGKITRDEFLQHIPEEQLQSVFCETMSNETLPRLFENIDRILTQRGIKQVDVIIGGPPCQAYSLVGRAQSKHMETPMSADPRNDLYKLYARFLQKYHPKMFVFENVMGIKSANSGATWLKVQEALRSVGYEIECHEQNSKNFGVLQNRRRMIIVGWLKNTGLSYPQFEQTIADATVNDILSDLPALQPGGKSGEYRSDDFSDYLRSTGIRKDSDILTHHCARPNKDRDIEIYRRTIELWNDGHKRLNYNDLPDELKTHKNRKSFLDRFKVVEGDEAYCHTMLAHISKDGHYFIHPDIEQHRSITVREAARIQSFPDDYFFEGPRTAQFVQIGNAVPTLMASDIVQIDSRADVIIFSSSVVTAKMDLMQRFFGFEQYIRAGAQKTIEIIRDLDIVDSLEKFVAFENKSKLTNAKKLLKAKNSPVLQMKKNDLLENLKKHSRYKTMFKFEEDHIVISSQKEAAAFIKMLNDDIVRSELTGKEYDSSSKMLLGPVGASH